MIEILHSNFIRTAALKAYRCTGIILRHALKPTVGRSFLTWGCVCGDNHRFDVVESIFGLPGIGQLFVNGALNRDYSLVLSLTILVGRIDHFIQCDR